ncbi:MAG: hypothetical protein KDC38_18280 [Planctomycetes bacterium]|nr:hypothetical protein [Planctomycetota bacterium]
MLVHTPCSLASRRWRRLERARRLAILVAVLVSATPALAQYSLSADHAEAVSGGTASVALHLDNLDSVVGFQLAVLHDDTVALPSAIAIGAALEGLNEGTGPDYFFVDLEPTGGTGIVIACVTTLGGTLDAIPAGAAHEIARIDYAVSSTATSGASTALDFTDGLGAPPVLVLVALPGGATVGPITVSGSVGVIPEPMVDLSCILTDPCACEGLLTWSNGSVYDEIKVLVDGEVVATLAGDTTSTPIVLPDAGTFEICVIGRENGAESQPTCCSLTCAAVSPLPIDSLSCSADSACVATASWSNSGVYASIEILLDGVPVATLVGSATETAIPLSGTGSFELCVVPSCQNEAAASCCIVECLPLFVRGDANGDGMRDIGDAISILNFLFAEGPASPCADASDVNDDGGIDIGDAISLLSFLFGTPSIPIPDPDSCGSDPTGDPLDCVSYPLCG